MFQWKMISGQCLLNIMFTVIIAYLLKVVWDQPAKGNNLSQGEGHTRKARDRELNLDLDQGHVITSVWCHHGNNKLCQFENLCYNSEEDEFVMFRDEASIIENVKVTDGSMVLDLSSIQGHNAMQTTVTSLPSKYSKTFKISWIEETTLVFKRFLPNNLMHLFHDDILPLYDIFKYLTYIIFNPKLTYISERSMSYRSMFDPFNVQLMVFNDTVEDLDEDIEMFYKMFSKFPVKFKKDFIVLNGLTCFKDVTLGLSPRTVWYDYGFTSPQSPLNDIKITSDHVKSTVKYVMHNLGLSDTMQYSECIVLLTRKENRRILNEMDLTLELARSTSMRVVSLSLETHTLVEMISSIRQCRGIIGMHGSLLILSMFLRPYSFVVEMFPYAVNPDKYTPYKTFCQTEGINLVYTAWANQKRDKSVGHPDWLPELGGIDHLEDDQREVILSETEVPPHLCCSDPSWLYHIYQDTEVDITVITSLVQSSLEQADHLQTDTRQSQNPWNVIQPSKVKGVRCRGTMSYTATTSSQTSNSAFYLDIKFNPPWTNSVIKDEDIFVTYEILIQDTSPEHSSVFSHKTINQSLTIGVDQDGVYVIWVRGVANNVSYGPYSDSVYCTKDR